MAEGTSKMNRELGIEQMAERERVWDLIVVGGGATGLGTALDAAGRGLKTLLVEAADFAEGTSSRSTKLIHGGVRYLRQGNVGLVREGLRERGRLLRNASSWVKPLPFVIPVRSSWEKFYYAMGLKIYDGLGGSQGLEGTQTLGSGQMEQLFPGLKSDWKRGGVRYWDAQFDDARFAIRLAQEVHGRGGVALNYCPVIGLMKQGGKVAGVVVRDAESGGEYEVRSRVVVNAAGIFSDAIRLLDDVHAEGRIRFSQGSHLVLDREYLPGSTALMIPKTEDGRVLFAIPWLGRTLFGTTDVSVESAALEPRPMASEVEYLLKHAHALFGRRVEKGSIRAAYAGIRPLMASGRTGPTAALSRDHSVEVSGNGLITIAGGKWTSYRRMAEETVDRVVELGGWSGKRGWTGACVLGDLGDNILGGGGKMVGWSAGMTLADVNVGRAVREEMARTVGDVLARRTRVLFLDAKRSMEWAPEVAGQMAQLLGRDRGWVESEVKQFHAMAEGYLVGEVSS